MTSEMLQRPWSRYPMALLGLFLLIFLALAIAPTYRGDWLLENVLVAAALISLITTFKRLRFSNQSYTLLFAFLVLHELGAHFTYSLVPYDDWVYRWSGISLNALVGLERNSYDRLIHFAYGALLLRPASELLQRVAPATGAWRYVLAALFVCSHSVIYELIEFGAALVFGGNLGTAYLGTQGDVWDAQKDMACAVAGTLVSTAVMLLTCPRTTARSRGPGVAWVKEARSTGR